MTGDEIAARALSVYGKGWVYEWGAKPAASVPLGASGVRADCTGYAWWAAGKRQSGRIQPGQGADSWRPLLSPVVGCVVWHAADIGRTSGHVGVVIAVHADGQIDTVDCSSTPAGPRGGAVRLLRDCREFWRRPDTLKWGYAWPVWATPGETTTPGARAATVGLIAAGLAAAVWAQRRARSRGLVAKLRK